MLFRYIRQYMALAGINKKEQHRILKSVRSADDWPVVWRNEATLRATTGDHLGATSCLYLGRFMADGRGELYADLTRECGIQYKKVAHSAPLERIWVEQRGGGAAAYLQIPQGAPGPAPLVVVVPGLGTIKEIMHPIAERFLGQGFAVARPELPGCGDTTGIGNVERWEGIATDLLLALADDDRIDHADTHLFGTCVGGLIAIKTASFNHSIRSVSCVSPMFDSWKVLASLSEGQAAVLEQAAGAVEFLTLDVAAPKLSVAECIDKVRAPLLLFHGGRDRAIPVSHTLQIEKHATADVEMHLFPLEDHRCLGKIDEILETSVAFIQRHSIRKSVVQEPAPQQLDREFRMVR